MADTILQVPYGTRDVLPGEAAARRQMEDKICSLFSLWGYDEVATPTFELNLREGSIFSSVARWLNISSLWLG